MIIAALCFLIVLAAIGSQLTDDEVNDIAHELETKSKPESADAIRHAIMAVTSDHRPSDADIARVRAHLAAGGWPLAQPGRAP